MLRIKASLLVLLVCLAIFGAGPSGAQDIPLPQPDPEYPNLFYGAVPTPSHLPPDIGDTAVVLVFVHGLNGTPMVWWENNDMYTTALWTGYRTAFVGLSPDNSPNSESIETNALVLQELLPRIAQHYNAKKMYLIGHSKGGVDIQAALLDPAIAALVRAVFTISSPNQGTELADWAFDHPDLAGPLNLLTPGVESLKTDNMATFRDIADPVFREYGIPFFTLAGTDYTENGLTLITGSILKSLVPGIIRDTLNDGFVTVARTKLPDDYSADLGFVPNNHLATNRGSITFDQISARIKGLEFAHDEFDKIAGGGFVEYDGGGYENSWIWSAKWFKGKLYVGTGRLINCVSILISDVNTGTNFYPLNVLSGHCPDAPTLADSLESEIWQYTPETGAWQRVFKSPKTIPIAFDAAGEPIRYTARDIGFRGMTVFQEPTGVEDEKIEVLYVGGVTSGSIFDPVPFGPEGYPPPRLLHTVDGTNWEPVPQQPGTFLGDLGSTLIGPQSRIRGFRSMVSYDGKLFATVSDFIGSGVIIASANPAAGDDAWQFVSPPRDEFPVWTLTTFNDHLYATTGLTEQQDPDKPGYGVYKTKAQGDPPYTFLPVVVNGGYQPDKAFRSPNGLSFAEFNGQLYMGTNRPTELIRINPDDSWELVVGEPRDTPQGYKAPISGFGNGFANGFIGHFWRMASYNGNLYLGCWDWSALLQGMPFLDPLNKIFAGQFGFDLLRTDDGVHWTAITRSGMGVPYNTGVRSLEPSPFGLFMGTAAEKGHGGDVYLTLGPEPDENPAPPQRLSAASESEVGRNVVLSWEPSPGAIRYRVYWAPIVYAAGTIAEQNLSLTALDGTAISATLEQVMAGELDYLCEDALANTAPCAVIQELKSMDDASISTATTPSVFPLSFKLASVVDGTAFSSTAPESNQSVYFIRAEDENGNISDPSNIVEAPSRAEPEAVTVPVTADIVTKKVKISRKHNRIHLQGKLYLPEGFWLDNLSPVMNAVITLAGVEVADQRVEFKVKGKKGDKWRYKDKKNTYGPIKKLNLNWHGAKFDYRYNNRLRIKTHFIGETETVLCIRTKKSIGAFTVELYGTTIAYDKRGNITTDLGYEPQKKDNSHVHFTLPFRLTSDSTIKIGGAKDLTINVADHYRKGFASYELKSILEPGLVLKSSKISPIDLEYNILIGQGHNMIAGSDLINLEKNPAKKNKKYSVYSYKMRSKHRGSK